MRPTGNRDSARLQAVAQHLGAARTQGIAGKLRSEVDPKKLREKYQAERDKRLSAQGGVKGQDQYIQDLAQSEKWAALAMDPYSVEGKIERAPVTDREVEVLCVGAGFGGLLSAARCKMRGVHDVMVVEKGSDVGGTWYWNQVSCPKQRERSPSQFCTLHC